MKRIILTTSLFFCLAITTVLAQSTTNIATPNSSGLSDNQVVSFDVNSDGTILNNSAADGTAQLGGTAVTANSNITTGSEANLILFQVTGTTVSDLDGTIEVFGTEAGLIIANPNGITCAGCGFINADRVDLVTGTYNIATGTYSISDNDFTIDNGGLLARNVGVLNIQTNNFTNNDVDLGVSADTFNLSVAGDFDNEEIEANTFNLSLAGDFNQRQHVAIEANTFNLSIAGDFDKIVNYINGQFITNSNGRIEVNAFNLNVDGDFTFSKSANNFTWTANDILTVSGTANITAADFNNSGTINVTNNNFNATVDTFINEAGATISAFGECNIVATTSSDNGTIMCQDFAVNDAMVIDIAEPDNGFSNNLEISFDVNANGIILNNSAAGGTAQLGDTAVDPNLNITAGSEADLILFQITGSTVSDLYGTIEVFGTEAGLIIANPNGIDCNGCAFINTNRVDLVTGSNYDFNTNTFGDIAATNIDIASSGLSASVLKIQTGADFINAGAIVADTVTIEVTNFASNIANTGTVSSDNLNFILTADFSHNSDSFTGFTNFSNLGVSTDGAFTNDNTINLAGRNLTITANSFNNTGGVVISDTFALSVAGDFDYLANYLGTITTSAFNLQVGGNFTYDDSANDFTWRANDSLTVSGSANITAANFNNSGTISADALTLSVAGAFDYVADYANGTITANTINLSVGGNFSNNDTNNDFTWRSTDTLTVSGNANIDVADFANSGTINVANNSLNITADTFSNAGGVLNVNTLALSVAGNFDYDEGSITTTAFNLNVDGDFSYDASANDFTWRSTDILTVLGNANIVAADFANSGTINVTNIFDITAAADFTNSGTISANSFNAIVDDFINESGARITAAECNLVHTTYTDNGTIRCLDSEGETEIINIARPDNNGLSNNSYTDFNIPNNGIILNNSDSAGTSQLAGDISKNTNYNSGDAASIILNQVTGTIISLLVGTLEVFGAEAVVIIANPNGITCNGCAFLNASRVDLVTASSYNFDADSFDSIENTNIAILENGLDASSSGILNIHAGGFTNTVLNDAGGFTNIVLNAKIFNLSLAGDFDYANIGTINADSFNLGVGGNFTNNDAANNFVWAANDTLTVSGNASIDAADFTNSGTITIENSFDIIAAASFNNSGTINVTNSFDIIAAADFANSGTINVTNIFDITETNFTNAGTINANTLNTTFTASNNFSNVGVLNADTFNLDVADDFDYLADYLNNGTITTNALNLTAGGDFTFSNSANNLIWRANDNLTVLGTANITAADFDNSGTITVTNSFDITEAADFANSGTISANSFDITEAADFANSGTINVTNSFDITEAADFDNRGTINVTNIFDITATDFTNAGTISADSFNAMVNSFINESGATITAAECNLNTTSYTDNGTITCQINFVGDAIVSFNIAVPSSSSGLSINSYIDFTIPINGVVFNNSDSDTTSQLAGPISANPNISSGNAASIILAQVTGNDMSLLAGALEVVGAEAVVLIANPNGISCNACSFINASRVDLVTGFNYNSSAESFNNITNGNIAIIDNGLNASSSDILNIHAGSFTNTGGLQANTLNLNVVGDFDYTQRGIINATRFNLEVVGDFSNNDESTGFVWEERDTLTVGSANITALNFINHGAIDITGSGSSSGSFEITAGYTVINQGSIVSGNGSLDITTDDFFRNLTGGDIAVNTLNIIARGKVTNTATIDVATLNITANNNSARTDDRTGFYVSNRGNITATNLNIEAVDNFYNRGNITATNFNITRAKDIFFLNKEIDSYDATYDGGNIFLNGDSSFIADGGIIENYGNIISLNGDSSFIADGGSIQNYGHIDLGNNTLDLTADSFTNHEGATIDAFRVNLTVSSYINDGTVDADAVIVSDATIDQ